MIWMVVPFAVRLGAAPGPDWIKDVVPVLGLWLKLFSSRCYADLHLFKEMKLQIRNLTSLYFVFLATPTTSCKYC